MGDYFDVLIDPTLMSLELYVLEGMAYAALLGLMIFSFAWVCWAAIERLVGLLR